MMGLVALLAVAVMVWILWPMFRAGERLPAKSSKKGEKLHRRDAVEETHRSLEELETDFAEGKIDLEGYQTAKDSLLARLAELEGKAGRGAR